MNKFNRVVMIIILLIILLVSITAVVNKFVDLFKWSDILDTVISSIGSNIYIAAAILGVIFVVSLILLIFEFRKKE